MAKPRKMRRLHQQSTIQPTSDNDDDAGYRCITEDDVKEIQQQQRKRYDQYIIDMRVLTFLLCLMVANDGSKSYFFFMMFYYAGLPFSFFYGLTTLMLIFVSYLICCTCNNREKIGFLNITFILDALFIGLNCVCLVACGIDYLAEQEHVMPGYVSFIIMRMAINICYLCYMLVTQRLKL